MYFNVLHKKDKKASFRKSLFYKTYLQDIMKDSLVRVG